MSFSGRTLFDYLTQSLGELWDLEALAQICAETQRYTFLVTSQPLNLPCGVASPANVMAIL